MMSSARTSTDDDFWDRDPVTPEERDRKLQLLSDQVRELGNVLEARVTCPCGRSVSLVHAFCCFFCGIHFCRRCAARHFGAGQRT